MVGACSDLSELGEVTHKSQMLETHHKKEKKKKEMEYIHMQGDTTHKTRPNVCTGDYLKIKHCVVEEHRG